MSGGNAHSHTNLTTETPTQSPSGMNKWRATNAAAPAATQSVMYRGPFSEALRSHISTTDSDAMTPKARPRRKASKRGPGRRMTANPAPTVVARPARGAREGGTRARPGSRLRSRAPRDGHSPASVDNTNAFVSWGDIHAPVGMRGAAREEQKLAKCWQCQ